MQNGLMAQTAETCMSVYDLYSFAYDNVAKYREEGEDGGKGGLAVDDEEGHVVDLQSVCEVPYACATGVCVCDDYDFVSSIDEFLDVVRRTQWRGGGGCIQWTADTYDSLHPLIFMRRQSMSSERCSYRVEGRSYR